MHSASVAIHSYYTHLSTISEKGELLDGDPYDAEERRRESGLLLHHP